MLLKIATKTKFLRFHIILTLKIKRNFESEIVCDGSRVRTATTMPKEKECDRNDIPRVWENARSGTHAYTQTEFEQLSK